MDVTTGTLILLAGSFVKPSSFLHERFGFFKPDMM